MTSQVAVMNLRGIALASDTVVSITTNSETKTMGNTAKVYELGSNHKVLIMHSGATQLNSVPNSLYISEWAKTIPTPLPTLQDYVDSFVKWAGRDSYIHSSQSEGTIIRWVLQEHYRWVQRNSKSELENLAPLKKESKEDFQQRRVQAVDEEIQKGLDFLEQLKPIKGLTELQALNLMDLHGFNLDEWFDYYFGDMPSSPVSRLLMKSSAAKALSGWQSLDSDSTLAFVGYGADEPFGGSIKVVIRGIYGNALRVSIDDRFGVASDDQTGITHFAQGDAISAFLRGYNWKITNQINSLFENEIREKINMEISQEVIDEVVESVEKKLGEYSHSEFVSPLLDTINAMSIQSLGEFAESLVGLQATSTYAQAGPATVGGLIEVATIDRTNGVRWMKSLTERNGKTFSN
jgi:hypothetical protein